MKLCNQKRAFGAVTLVAAAVMLAACGGDDDDDSGGGGGGGGGGDTASFNGTLENQDFHPLQAEIEDGTIAPEPVVADQTTCPDGTGTGLDDETESVTIFGEEFPVCTIDTNFLGDGMTYTLTNDHVYLLNGNIKVGNGGVEDSTTADVGGSVDAVTLEIDAGTQIFANEGSDSLLRVTRGSTLNVNGTLDEPVIFSAAEADISGGTITGDPTDFSGRGQWGGVVLDGFATTNNGDGSGANMEEIKSEAAPSNDDDVFFGGSDDNDSSGMIEYIVIAESGFPFRVDQEVQGLTVEGVGDGTTISHIQVLGSEDDGIEWFGGRSNNDHIVINGADDDALDMDEGFSGSVQYALVRIGVGEGDSGIEADNLGAGDFDATPKTMPFIANLTIFGNDGKGESAGVNNKEGFAGQILQSVFIDDNQTVAPDDGDQGYQTACFKWEDEVDVDLRYDDVLVSCGDFGATLDTTFGNAADAGNSAEAGGGEVDGTITFNVTEDNAMVIESNLGITPASATTNLDLNAEDSRLMDNDYFGAVDPGAGGTPWWQEWTVDVAND